MYNCSITILESNCALYLSGRKNSFRYFINTAQKLDEDQNYEPIYSPMLRSNLTIHRTPTITYDEPTLAKIGNNTRRNNILRVFYKLE